MATNEISSVVVEIFAGLLYPKRTGRLSVSEVLTSSLWLESERGKQLPETITTLALTRQTSHVHLVRLHFIPLSLIFLATFLLSLFVFFSRRCDVRSLLLPPRRTLHCCQSPENHQKIFPWRNTEKTRRNGDDFWKN